MSFLTLMGMVSAGTYSQVNYNGMFKVAEKSSLNTKFDKDSQEKVVLRDDYVIEKSYMFKGDFDYVSCYISNDKGCIVCDGEELSKGYGLVYNFVQNHDNNRKDITSYSGFSNAFRDNFKTNDCDTFGEIVNYNSGKRSIVCVELIN